MENKELIERVAMEIAVADYNHRDDLSCENSGLYAAENWGEYVTHAKAAISAMPKSEQGYGHIQGANAGYFIGTGTSPSQQSPNSDTNGEG